MKALNDPIEVSGPNVGIGGHAPALAISPSGAPVVAWTASVIQSCRGGLFGRLLNAPRRLAATALDQLPAATVTPDR